MTTIRRVRDYARMVIWQHVVWYRIRDIPKIAFFYGKYEESELRKLLPDGADAEKIESHKFVCEIPYEQIFEKSKRYQIM